jgi:hypothetical protein
VLRLRRDLVSAPHLEIAVVTGASGPALGPIFRPRRPGAALLAVSSNPHRARQFEQATGIVCGTFGPVGEALSRWPTADGPVVLVEQGHRVATIELAALARRAEAAGSRVVLLADPDRQRWSETFCCIEERRGIGRDIESEPAPRRRVPRQVVNVLGPAPASLVERSRWRDAADALSAYRERWHITGDRALGGGALSVEQRAERRQVERSMARVVSRSRERSGHVLTR